MVYRIDRLPYSRTAALPLALVLIVLDIGTLVLGTFDEQQQLQYMCCRCVCGNSPDSTYISSSFLMH